MAKLDTESKTWLFGLMSHERVGDVVVFNILGNPVYLRVGGIKRLFGIVFRRKE